MIADERNPAVTVNPTLASGAADCEPDQRRAAVRHFGEDSKAEVAPQAGVLHFLPRNTGQVAGHKPDGNAAPPQSQQQHASSGTHAAFEIGANPRVNGLCGSHQLRHGAADEGVGGARVLEHQGQDVAVEHALHGNAIGGRLKPGDPAHSFGQRLPVVWTGAADQGTIDVKQDERGRGRRAAPVFGSWHLHLL